MYPYPLYIERVKNSPKGTYNGTGYATLLVSARGREMKLQIGLTLATVFLALFTVAMWREKFDRETREGGRKRFGAKPDGDAG